MEIANALIATATNDYGVTGWAPYSTGLKTPTAAKVEKLAKSIYDNGYSNGVNSVPNIVDVLFNVLAGQSTGDLTADAVVTMIQSSAEQTGYNDAANAASAAVLADSSDATLVYEGGVFTFTAGTLNYAPMNLAANKSIDNMDAGWTTSGSNLLYSGMLTFGLTWSTDQLMTAIEASYEEGYNDGYDEGYADGFADGVASVTK